MIQRREAPMAIMFSEADSEANRQDSTQSHNCTNSRDASPMLSDPRQLSVGRDTSGTAFYFLLFLDDHKFVLLLAL